MGPGGIGIWQLLIILVIFGTKKVRNLGSDLGSAIKGFKKAVGEKEEAEAKKDSDKASKVENKEAKSADSANVEAGKEKA